MARYVCTPRTTAPVVLPGGRPLAPGERVVKRASDVSALVEHGALRPRPSRRAATGSTSSTESAEEPS